MTGAEYEIYFSLGSSLPNDPALQVVESSNEKVSQISERLEGISRTVEQTAAMAEQSAAASEELDGQAIVLRDNISHYQVN